MMIPVTRASTSLAAVLVSLVCLMVLVFVLVGPEDFVDQLKGAAGQVAVICAIAGIVRMPFSRGGFVLSLICGASLALAGFLIVLAYAASRI